MMMMFLRSLLWFALWQTTGQAFVSRLPLSPSATGTTTTRILVDSSSSQNQKNDDETKSSEFTESSVTSLLIQQGRKSHRHLDEKLTAIGHKLRLRVYDVDTGVYGLESNDPNYGIETVRTFLHLDEEDDKLGLELTEVAHGGGDHRGLVMVSAVHGEAKVKPVHVGDVLVGVFCGEHFKESTTGMDYDETVQVLERAKHYARSVGGSTISVEINRLVKRVPVQVVVEHGGGGITQLEAKAGDNLRLLLLHHHLSNKLYEAHTHRIDQPRLTGNCGGEGICGTCVVSVLQGMEHLNAVGPQESSLLRGFPPTWRMACKTVVGADNEPGTTLRIQLHPQTLGDDTNQKSKLRP